MTRARQTPPADERPRDRVSARAWQQATPLHEDDEYYDEETDSYVAVQQQPRGRRVTPVRVVLVLVVIGAAAVALYGVFVARSLALAVSGLAVLGIGLLLLGVLAGAAAVSAGRRGSAGVAVLAALFGGGCVLAGAGSLAGAIVLGILTAAP